MADKTLLQSAREASGPAQDPDSPEAKLAREREALGLDPDRSGLFWSMRKWYAANGELDDPVDVDPETGKPVGYFYGGMPMAPPDRFVRPDGRPVVDYSEAYDSREPGFESGGFPVLEAIRNSLRETLDKKKASEMAAAGDGDRAAEMMISHAEDMRRRGNLTKAKEFLDRAREYSRSGSGVYASKIGKMEEGIAEAARKTEIRQTADYIREADRLERIAHERAGVPYQSMLDTVASAEDYVRPGRVPDELSPEEGRRWDLAKELGVPYEWNARPAAEGGSGPPPKEVLQSYAEIGKPMSRSELKKEISSLESQVERYDRYRDGYGVSHENAGEASRRLDEYRDLYYGNDWENNPRPIVGSKMREEQAAAIRRLEERRAAASQHGGEAPRINPADAPLENPKLKAIQGYFEGDVWTDPLAAERLQESRDGDGYRDFEDTEYFRAEEEDAPLVESYLEKVSKGSKPSGEELAAWDRQHQRNENTLAISKRIDEARESLKRERAAAENIKDEIIAAGYETSPAEAENYARTYIADTKRVNRDIDRLNKEGRQEEARRLASMHGYVHKRRMAQYSDPINNPIDPDSFESDVAQYLASPEGERDIARAGRAEIVDPVKSPEPAHAPAPATAPAEVVSAPSPAQEKPAAPEAAAQEKPHAPEISGREPDAPLPVGHSGGPLYAAAKGNAPQQAAPQQAAPQQAAPQDPAPQQAAPAPAPPAPASPAPAPAPAPTPAPQQAAPQQAAPQDPAQVSAAPKPLQPQAAPAPLGVNKSRQKAPILSTAGIGSNRRLGNGLAPSDNVNFSTGRSDNLKSDVFGRSDRVSAMKSRIDASKTAGLLEAARWYFLDPVERALQSAGDMYRHASYGNWGASAQSAASTAGNTAMALTSALPVAGLAGGAAKVGARSLLAGARAARAAGGTGSLFRSVAGKLTSFGRGASAVSKALPVPATRGGKIIFGAAGTGMAGAAMAPRPSSAAVKLDQSDRWGQSNTSSPSEPKGLEGAGVQGMPK